MSFAKIEYFSKTFAKKSKIPKILDKKSLKFWGKKVQNKRHVAMVRGKISNMPVKNSLNSQSCLFVRYTEVESPR